MNTVADLNSENKAFMPCFYNRCTELEAKCVSGAHDTDCKNCHFVYVQRC